eukprot:gene39049-51374_t
MDFEDIYETDENIVSPSGPNVPPPLPAMSFELPEPELEEDALVIFNKSWNQKLEAKRAAEFEHEKASRAKAQEDYATWKTQRDIRLNSKKESNRSEEQVLLEALESEVEMLRTWDRVTKLIDSSVEATEVVNGPDVSRMKKLFIQLKNEPLEVTRGLIEAK